MYWNQHSLENIQGKNFQNSAKEDTRRYFLIKKVFERINLRTKPILSNPDFEKEKTYKVFIDTEKSF